MLITAVAQTPIVWDSLSSQQSIDQYNQLKNIVQYELVEGSGPSANRVDMFYFSHYIEGRGSMPTTNMEDVVGDYNYRITAAADMHLRDIDRSADAGNQVIANPLLRHNYKRYAPFMKLWKQNSIRVDYPMYPQGKYKSELHSAALANTQPDWGPANFFMNGVTGAGAAGDVSNAKVCGTPYVSDSGTAWAWVHERTHAHHKLGHGGNARPMKTSHINGESNSLTRNATFEPTAAMWGQWMGYDGKGIENLSTYDGPPMLDVVGMDKDVQIAFMDVGVDNAAPLQNRIENAIFIYHKAFDPLDTWTDNSAVLVDPATIDVEVASTDVITLRWYVNGTEIASNLGLEQLDVAALGLASGTYKITVEAYDSVVDHAFTGDKELDLVRRDFERLCQVEGWTVSITSGGANSYDQSAALTKMGGGAFSAADFTSSPAGKTAVFPANQGLETLTGSGLNVAGLRFEGDYLIDGSGAFNLASGSVHSLPTTLSQVTTDAVIGGDLVKTGLGEFALGGNTTLSTGKIDVQQGTLTANASDSFGDVTEMTIRRGAQAKLNAGETINNLTMEGFSALWADTGAEEAVIDGLTFQKMGDANIGYQFHNYFKIGTGTLAFDGAVTLDDTVMVLTGDDKQGELDPTQNMYRTHWMMDMGRGGSFDIRGNVSGFGSIVVKHGGPMSISGSVNLQGEHDELDHFRGLFSMIYGSHVTVEPGGSLAADVIDLSHYSTLEYNGSQPLVGTIIPAHQTREGSNHQMTFPGFWGHLCGTGDITSQVVMRNGSSASPGAFGQVGRQDLLGGMFIDNVATIDWQIADTDAANDVDGLPTGWDVYKISGTLDLDGVMPSGAWKKNGNNINEPVDEVVDITLKLSSMGLSASQINLDPAQNYSFLIAEADAVVGFDPAKFSISFEAGSALASLPGEWGVALVNGTRIELQYVGGAAGAPVVKNQTLALDENQSAGSSVGFVNPTSFIGTLAWSLTDDAGGLFTIDAVTGEIATTAVLDAELQSSYSLVVSVTDDSELTDTATVTIQVNNVNEPPVLADVQVTVPRSVAPGVIATLNATDDDVNDSVSYHLAATASSLFSINSTTGDLSLTQSLVGQSFYVRNLAVYAIDSSGLVTQAVVSIAVNEDGVINDFTGAGGNLSDAANWSQGSPDGSTPGFVNADGLINSKLNNYDLIIQSGTITRAENTVYEWTGDTDIVIAGGLLDYTANSASGNSHRVLRLKNTSSLTMEGGELKLWGDRSIEFFDQGTIIIRGGKLSAESFGIGNTVAQIAFVTFEAGDGELVLSSLPAGLDATRYIDFHSGSAGKLTVSNADAAYYEAIWNNGGIKVDGANNGSFASLFEVDGNTLTLRPVIAPVLADTSFDVDEGLPVGSVVGQLDAVYSTGVEDWDLTNDGGGAFSIDEASGEIITAVVLDADVQSLYQLSALVTDDTGHTATASITVNVLAVNAAPVASNGSGSVSEDAAIGTPVVTASASDPGDTLTYAITGGNASGAFAIDAGTGEISTAAALDYETVTSYSLTVTVTDSGGLSDSALIDITVTDVVEVNEYLVAGGNLSNANNWSVSAPDANTAGVVTVNALIDSVLNDYDLILQAGTITRAESSVYEWRGDTDVVIDGATLDYTANSASGNTHRVLRLIGTSSLEMQSGEFHLWSDRNIEFFDEGTIVIHGGVLNAGGLLNKSSMVGPVLTFDIGDGVVNISGTNINLTDLNYIDFLTGTEGKLAVTGADAAYFESKWNSGEIKHDGANNGSFTSLFKVTGNTLELRAIPLPVVGDANVSVSEDAAIGAVVTQMVATSSTGTETWALTSDAGGLFVIDPSTGAISTTATLNYESATNYLIVVSLTDDAGEAVSANVSIDVTNVNEAPSVGDSSGSAAEDAPVGTVVASVSSSDPDAGDSVSYTVTGGPFAIDVFGVISTTAALDYESASAYSLTVTATDTGGLSDTATVTVSVTNVNEAPSVADTSGSVAENASTGTVVASVSVSDPDAGDSFTYSVAGGPFSIDAFGVISTTAVLDYESAASFSLTVTATDAGGLSDSASVVVSVTNVNETPTADDLFVSLSESASVGTLVGTVTSGDPDGNDSVTYSITAGNEDGAFTIDAGSGDITTVLPLDYETVPDYLLTVTATDAGGLSATAIVDISLIDEQELPDPVIHWALNDGSGASASDSSVNGRDGLITGSPLWTNEGRSAGALELDGTDDKVGYTMNTLSVSAYTVSIWVKSASDSQNQFASVMSNDSTTSGSTFQIDLGGGGYRYNGSGNAQFGDSPLGEWVHLVVSCDGTDTKLYYNGALVQTLTGVADTQFNDFHLGVNRNGVRHFQGALDDFRFYDQALSDAEVADLFALYQDTDSDLLSDSWELENFASLAVSDGTGDADSDGLNDADEFLYGTDPNISDTDVDGHSDLTEVNAGSDPLDPLSQP